MPERKYTRLKYYDYRSPGAYFVTVCTEGRLPTLGVIRHGQSKLGALGRLVSAHLASLPQRYNDQVKLDCAIVMPNHLHAVAVILPNPQTHQPVHAGPGRERDYRYPQGVVQASLHPTRHGGVIAGELGAIVGSLKSGISREWHELSGSQGPVFQAGFYEHVIRHEKALERIRSYVLNNPQQWEIDRENPRKIGENEFYAWLETYSRKVKDP